MKNLNESVKKEYNGILAGGNSLCFLLQITVAENRNNQKIIENGGRTDLDSEVGGRTAARPPVLLLHTPTPSPLMRKGQGLKETERSTDEKTILCSTITQTHTLIPFISMYNGCVKCPQFLKALDWSCSSCSHSELMNANHSHHLGFLPAAFAISV